MTGKSTSTKAAVRDEAIAQEYDAAWQAGLPAPGPTWTARPWVHPTQRAEAGKAARKRVPRASHAAFEPRAGPRPDRDPRGAGGGPARRSSCPCATSGWPSRRSPTTGARRRSWRSTSPATPRIRHHRPGERRRPPRPTSGSSPRPERTLVFDANDFDETLPGPWEWDVKRLAASVVIAGRANGFSAAAEPRGGDGHGPQLPRSGWPATPGCASSTSGTRRSPTTTSARRPRRRACSRAATAPLAAQRLEAIFSKARQRDGMRAFESLTGRRRRSPGHPRRPAGRHARRCARRPCRAREGLHRLPGDHAREPARLPRALPVRRLRPQGRRRRERRDPLLHPRPRGPRRERPAHPPGEGGDGIGAGAVPRRRAPTRTTPSASSSASSSCRRRPTSSSAGRPGPGGRDFYIRQLWDMKGSVDIASIRAAGPRLLRRPLRLVARPGPRAQRRRGRDRRLPRDGRHVRRCDRRLRRDLCRRQRARPRGVPRRDQGGQGVDTGSLLTAPKWT